MENYLFEHGSNPSLRKAIEQPNSKATNRRASQPTNPLFNVATIINHLGYLYFCISLWDSRHIQAIGAKFSSLSIYIRDDGSITRLARLVFILYPGWHPARHPFSPQRAACTWIFTNFERKRGGRQHHRPSPPRVACQPTFIFAPVFDPFHPFDPRERAELLQLREPVWRNRIPLPAKVNRDGTWLPTFRDLIFFSFLFEKRFLIKASF